MGGLMINWIQAVVKKSKNCSKWPKSVEQLQVEQSQLGQFTPTHLETRVKISELLSSSLST
jgi:hypothetical protein